MSKRKTQFIEPLPMNKKRKNSKIGVSVSEENLTEAYTQIFQLKAMIEQHIPMLEMENEKKDADIKKLKTLYRLKDDELKKQIAK